MRKRNGTGPSHGGLGATLVRELVARLPQECVSMRLARSESASSPSPDEPLPDGPLPLDDHGCLWSQQAQQLVAGNQDSATSGSSGDIPLGRPFGTSVSSFLAPSPFYPSFLSAPFSPSAGPLFSHLCGLQPPQGVQWTGGGGSGGLPGLGGWQQQQLQQQHEQGTAVASQLLQASPLHQILPGLSEHLANSAAWHHLFQSEGVVDSIGRDLGVRAFLQGEVELEGGEGSENSTGSPEFSNRSDIPIGEEEPGQSRSAKKPAPRKDDEPVKRHGDKGLAGKEPGRRKAKRVGARDDESEMKESKEGKKKKKRKRMAAHAVPDGQPLSSSTLFSGSISKDTLQAAQELPRLEKSRLQSPDQSVTWTDESVRFLFKTYDAIHQRLWIESNGHVKYQKKWTPILKAMQEKFGKHFSKKQCQSKYWSVRRECTDYRSLAAKIARSEPSWNPSIAGRELLKPKFYDVWFEVSGKNLCPPPRRSAAPGIAKEYKTEPELDEYLDLDSKVDIAGAEPHTGGFERQDRFFFSKEPSASSKQDKEGRARSSSSIRELHRLVKVELQASQKREEAMKQQAELMMNLLTSHMEQVEQSTAEDSYGPQLCVLERVNDKLEKLLDGFALLNQNILAAMGCRMSQISEHAIS